MDLRLSGRRGAFQEIEIAALVSLGDVLLVERTVSALETRRRPLPRGATARQFSLGYFELELAGGHVEHDQIAVLYEGERPPDIRFGRHVQDASAVTRAAHPRVGNANHV